MTTSQPKRIRAVAAVCAMLLLASCSAEPSAPPSWPTGEVQDRANSLPAGSSLVTPEELRDSMSTTSDAPYGSVRPDEREVAKRIPQIIERGRLVVGAGQYLNRLGFRDPLTGDLEGFEIDLAREIARDIFGDPNRVEFRYVENRRRESALRNGDVDMVVRTWTISRERQNVTEFSLPYLAINTKLLVQRNGGISGFGDLKNSTVCVTRDSAPARSVTDFEVKQLLLTRTWTDCLLAMQRHQADAIYSDDAILSGLHAQDPHTELVGEGSATAYYGVGMPAPESGRDSTGLAMQVNSTIERIRADGTWNRLYSHWMEDYLGYAQPLPAAYRSDEDSQRLARARQEYAREHDEPTTGRSADAAQRRSAR